MSLASRCRQGHSLLYGDSCPCLNAHNFIYKKYVNEPDAGIVFSLTNCLIKGGLVSVKQ